MSRELIRRTVFAFALGLALAGAWTADAGEESGSAPIVKNIRVRGSLAHTPEEIKYKMRTREGQPLDKKILEEDFRRLYGMGTFADVQIREEAVPGENAVNIIVLLREKALIRRILFRGNKQIKTRKLREKIESKVGERYDPDMANRDAHVLEDWYKSEFYYFAELTTKVEPFEDGVRLVFDIDEGGRLYIRKIVFRGNYSFSDKELMKYMEIKPSTLFGRGRYSRRTFEKDLERLRLFYQNKGYLDAEVTERPFQVTAAKPGEKRQRRDVYIFIDIDEGKQYRIGQIAFDGNALVEDNALRSIVRSAPGQVYSPQVIHNDERTIRDHYGLYPSSRYFTNVRAERVLTEQEDVVDVVFHIQEGPEVVIEDVQIRGNEKTKDYVIRRQLAFYPGEKIDSAKINISERDLRNLGYFDQATLSIDVKEGSSPSRGVVTVNVDDEPTGKISAGVGISSSEWLVGTVSLAQRNFDYKDLPESFKEFFTGKSFVGGGQKFSASVSAGTRSTNFSLDFMNPWIFNRPIRWGFGGYYSGYEWDYFDEERKGGYTTIGRRLWHRNLDGSITYRLEHVKVFDVDSDTAAIIQDDEGGNLLSRLKLRLAWDSRDNRFDPESGLLVEGTHEFIGGFLGGDRSFWKQHAEAKYFLPLYRDRHGRPWYLAMKADFDTLDGYFGEDKYDIPIYERLYNGGIATVRGFSSRSLGPRTENDVIGGYTRQNNSAEFFVPVWQKILKVSAFYDVGGIWDDTYSFDDGNHSGDDGGSGYRHSVGGGVHVITPLSPVPIRVYWTHALDPKNGDDTETVQFTFGAVF